MKKSNIMNFYFVGVGLKDKYAHTCSMFNYNATEAFCYNTQNLKRAKQIIKTTQMKYV